MAKMKIEFEEMKNFGQEGYALATFTDKVLFGKVYNNEAIFAENFNKDYLRELILFNGVKHYKYTNDIGNKTWKKFIVEDVKLLTGFEYEVFIKGQKVLNTKEVDGVFFSEVNADGASYMVPIKVEIGDCNSKDCSLKLKIKELYDFDDNNTIINKGQLIIDLFENER